MTLGFRPFRAAAATTAMATSTMPGYDGYWWSSSPSGGYAWYRYLTLRSPGIYRSDAIHVTASRSGVSGMPIERSEGGLTL